MGMLFDNYDAGPFFDEMFEPQVRLERTTTGFTSGTAS